ncbi:hypothetical protein LLE49_12915 [Alicyclobacillus tolerans]|uniref:hypothetical protein n=1 Tax=Alicyclobacillus tolerans TaxID=90970 RepID=UPI001F2B56CE|nr:hypothetical protein [Alicyclobacillus tolerans]MCF8565618.1 hypothetical protein [Alicyclobacillus tolerans]
MGLVVGARLGLVVVMPLQSGCQAVRKPIPVGNRGAFVYNVIPSDGAGERLLRIEAVQSSIYML